MPDRRTHRGPHPADARLFAPDQLETLRRAVDELSWLLSRGYADRAALKLVGDRYALTARQRHAVMRSSCSDASRTHRRTTRRCLDELTEPVLGIDGYNLLITVESALSGGVLLIGRDGCIRDLAGIHGTYRKVTETVPALERIIAVVEALKPRRVDWLLDQPVSNSGRLKTVIGETLDRLLPPDACERWHIELTPTPDQRLRSWDGVAVSSDAAILDHCAAWVNLSARIVESIPEAWIVDLRTVDEKNEPAD